MNQAPLDDSVYTLEKEQVQSSQRPPSDPESEALLADANSAADEKLSKALDKELDKIVAFYHQKEDELTSEYHQLVNDEREFQSELQATANMASSSSAAAPAQIGRRTSPGSLRKQGLRRASTGSLGPVDEGSSDEDTGPSRPGTSGWEEAQESSPVSRRATESAIYPGGGKPHVPTRRTSMVFIEDDPYSEYTGVSDNRITLKKRAISCYVSLSELRSFVQLNWTGFSKLLKKYDKTSNRNLRRYYLTERVEKAYPFLVDTRENLNEKISSVEEIYARIYTDEDIHEAQKELKLHLREHVVWERNTVWRDMIGIERKAQAAALGIRKPLIGGKAAEAGDVVDAETKELEIPTPVGRIRLPRWVPRWLFSASMMTLILALAIFFVLLVAPTFKSIEQSNCLAMLVFVSFLWATEVHLLSIARR